MINIFKINKKITNKSFAIWLLLIFLFSFSIRLIGLRVNPIAISHDELDYVLNGKMIALTGSDLTQTWSPWSLTPIQTETLTSEFFPILQSIVFNFLPLNLFNSRIISLIFSSLTVVVIGLLVEVITKNKKLAIISSLVYSISPWSILFSHTTYEAPNAILFYLLGIYLLLSISRQLKLKKSIIFSFLSVIFFILGFYSYHGYKLIFPLLVGVPFVWQWFSANKNQRKRLIKPYIFFASLMTLFVIRFLFSMGDYGNRQSELIFLNKNLLSSLVDSSRKLGFTSLSTKIFINKYTILIREMSIRYLNAFNPVNIFIAGGDSTILFSLFQSGYAYLIELPVLLFGGWFLHKKYKNGFYLLILLLLIAPIPAALHSGSSTALRAGMIFPIMSIFIGAGWLFIFSKKGAMSSLIKFVFASALFINFSYFLYVFNNNYPVYSADNYFFNERLLSEYVERNKDREIYVLTQSSYPAFRAHLFYQNKFNKDSVENLISQFKKGIDSEYQLDSIMWTSNCEVLNKKGDHLLIIEETMISKCDQPEMDDDWYQVFYKRWNQNYPQFISSPIDSRNYYVLVNSNLCDDKKLSKYVYNNSRDSFKVDDLTNDEFCNKWVMKEDKLNKKLQDLDTNGY